MTNKEKIFEQIKESFPVGLPDEELERLFFKRKDNIRLTYHGCRLMSSVFESYSFSHNNDFLSKHIIAISREFVLPYFLSKGQLIVFSSEDATMITLCGDVKTFLSRLT